MKHGNKTVDPDGFLLVKDYWYATLSFTGKVKWSDGSKCWFKNGKHHREDGPAVMRHDGTKYWYKNGLRHREDGPAIVNSDGRGLWYYNGKHGLENFPPEIKKNLARKFIHEA